MATFLVFGALKWHFQHVLEDNMTVQEFFILSLGGIFCQARMLFMLSKGCNSPAGMAWLPSPTSPTV